MADYNKTTNFTAKDALSTGNPAKVIKGSEHDTEYDNISTAIASKPDQVVPATTNNLAMLNASGDLADSTVTTDGAGVVTLASPVLTSPVINTAVSGTAILDEDGMSSDSATKVSTQQSIKAYVDAVETKIASLNTKIINIGDWNMDTTQSLDVAHGVTLSKIRSLSAIIIADSSTTRYDLNIMDGAGDGGGLFADATNVVLRRIASGFFDNTSFNSTSFNRGYIVLQYTD